MFGGADLLVNTSKEDFKKRFHDKFLPLSQLALNSGFSQWTYKS